RLGHQRSPPAAGHGTGIALLGLKRNLAVELERDVVVAGRSGDRCGLEVPFVHRDVPAPRGPVAGEGTPGGAFFARSQELHRGGNDIDCRAFGAVLGLPLPPLEAAVDGDGPSLGQEARGVLTLRAPYGHVEVVGLVLPFAGAAVLAAGVARNPQ